MNCSDSTLFPGLTICKSVLDNFPVIFIMRKGSLVEEDFENNDILEQ